MNKVITLLLMLVIGLGGLFQTPDAISDNIYYADSSIGNDANTCIQAHNPDTPKKTVNSVNACVTGGGDIVKFRGTFTETIFPAKSGMVLYEVSNIAKVEGAVVTFNQSIEGLNPETDFVTIYNSRKGNSGAFAVVSFSGTTVTVDTQYLPGRQFLLETANDPHFATGPLQAAIIRPVHYTAWDIANPPTFNTAYQVYKAINQRVIMVSYLKSISGNGYVVWPAFEVDGNNSGNSDFQIFDHLEIINTSSAISTEAGEYQSNYDIIQYNNIHDVGIANDGVADELIYWGKWGRPDLHHDFVQIMYNKVGPHKPGAAGDGIDTKQSVHNPTVFGNEIIGVNGTCGDAPIKSEASDEFIANNYIHGVHPIGRQGCGISIVDGSFDIWTYNRVIIANNIIADVAGVGISLVDVGNSEIYNNTIYNITPSVDPETDPEFNAAINVWAWQSKPVGNIIKNNIIHTAVYGIDSYWGALTSGITSDNNIVYNTTGAAYRYINKGANDREIDPQLADPANGNFSLLPGSPAINAGANLASIFIIDNHSASNPLILVAPLVRDIWDIGAFELPSGIVPTDTSTPTMTSTVVPTSTFTPTGTSTLVPTDTNTPVPSATRTATRTPRPTATRECIAVVFRDGTRITVCKP